jgi:hypothetical protein
MIHTPSRLGTIGRLVLSLYTFAVVLVNPARTRKEKRPRLRNREAWPAASDGCIVFGCPLATPEV